jgi:SAM-dependent methyltransferase
VLCAQSFHWFDEHAALREFHRILTPGGLVALVWNVRQEDGGLTSVYNALARRAQDDAQTRGKIVCRTRRASPGASDLFDRETLLTYDNPQVLSEDQLLGRIQSTSYYPPAGPLRDELDRAMHDAFAAYEMDGTVTLRQHTEMTLARRVSSSSSSTGPARSPA